MHTIIETRYVHHLCEPRLQSLFCPVHSLSYRTWWVELVTNLLQMSRNLPTLFTPLFWNLISDAPHDDGGMISMIQNQVFDVPITPFLEKPCIPILAFGIDPHVETFRHHHHSQRVANLHLPCRWHVVSSPDGITSHIFHCLDLPCQSRLVDSRSKRSQIMVKANTFYLSGFSIESKPFLLVSSDSSNSNLDVLFINSLQIPCQFYLQSIKIRSLWCPKHWFFHIHAVFEFSISPNRSMERSHNRLLHVPQWYVKSHYALVESALGTHLYLNFSHIIVNGQSSEISSPVIKHCILSDNQCNRPIQTTSRIPSTAFFNVLQTYLNGVFPFFQIRSSINPESIVTICPSSCLTSIYSHHRLAHCPIENQHGIIWCFIKFNDFSVEPFPYPRQSTRPSWFFSLFLFTILLNSHNLQIPFLVERSCNSPVMRHSHICPLNGITRKHPSIREKDFRTLCIAQQRHSQ